MPTLPRIPYESFRVADIIYIKTNIAKQPLTHYIN